MGTPGAAGRIPASRRGRLIRRSCAGLCIAVGVAVAVGFGWAAWYGVGLYRDAREAAGTLVAERTAARSAGLPLDPADLRPKPPVAANRNAAPALRQVSALYEALPSDARSASGDVQKALRSPARTDANREAARALLRERREMLELAEKAAGLPECDFARPYELGPDVQFREMAAIRESARLWSSQAILESDAGNPDRAYQLLADCGRLGRHAGSDPVVIALLVRLAVEAIADASFTQIVLDNVGDSGTVRAARAALPSFGPLPDLAYACRGEVVIGRVAIAMIRNDPDLKQLTGEDTSPSLARRLRDPRIANLMCDAWEARFLSYWRRAFEAFGAHPGDYRAHGAALDRLDKEIEGARGRVSYSLLSIMTPVFARVADKIAQTDARRQLREGLVRIAEHRLRTGSFPATLGEMDGKLLLDPFTGRSLLYRRTPRGFVLYSVGEDRKDDGGKGDRPSPDKPIPDLVIEYPRRPVL